MKYELIMLRQFTRMYKLSQCMSKEAKTLAIMSYGYELSCHGTVNQIEQICQKIQTCKNSFLFCQATYRGLMKLNKGERALLVRVYINGTAIKDIAASCKTSASTVYRRLLQSRCNFGKQLASLGYDEQWFVTNFLQYDFIADALGRFPVQI